MYKPVNELPPEYKKRCKDIIEEREIIDSEKKLDDFLHFMLDQGQDHREMREYTLLTCEHTLVKTSLIRDHHAYNKLAERLKEVWGDIIEYHYIGPSPHPESETDEEFSDKIWHRIRAKLEG